LRLPSIDVDLQPTRRGEDVPGQERRAKARPLQILHVLGTAQCAGRGIARIVVELSSRLDPRHYRSHAWFLGPSGPLAHELRCRGIDVREIGWDQGIRDVRGLLRFAMDLRSHDFAIVHQHFGARAVRKAVTLFSDSQLLVHLHSVPENSAKKTIAIRGANAVIADSRSIAREALECRPLVVYSGVSVPRHINWRRREGARDIVVGAASRLVPIKGLLNLIRATADLCADFKELRLEIAGEGPERSNLQSETRSLGIENRVRFLGWQPSLDHCLPHWDIFALPSLNDGLPIAALEAMASGLPVVGTRVGGIPELVEHGSTGLLAPPDNVRALGAKLRELILDKALRLRMGKAAYERARSDFSAEQMARKIAAIYHDLTAKAVNRCQQRPSILNWQADVE